MSWQYLAGLINASTETVRDARVEPEVLASEDQRAVYAAIVDVSERGPHVTSLLTKQAMINQGLAPSRVADLIEKTESAPQSISPATDAAELRRQHANRTAAVGLLKAADFAAVGNQDAALEILRTIFDGVVEDGPTVMYPPRLAELAMVEERGGVYVDCPRIDIAINRLSDGSLTIIGGQTGAGKSSLLLYLAERLVPFGIVSLEDPEEIWGQRCLTQLETLETHIATVCLRHHGVADVTEAMRVLVKRHGVKVLGIDYAQLITARELRGVRRAEQISSIVRELKLEAKRLEVPLILLSQIRRPDTTARWKEPTVFDLKETGDLENNAENVILLWKTSDEEDAQILGKVAKVKTSAARPRFELRRDRQGKLLDPLPYAHGARGTASKSWAGVGE